MFDRSEQLEECENDELPKIFSDVIDGWRMKNQDEIHIFHLNRIANTLFNMSNNTRSPLSGWCPFFYDNILCWPVTTPNTTVVLSCPEKFEGVRYDTSYNATRHCNAEGNWTKADYNSCRHIDGEPELPVPLIHLTFMYWIYWIGYSVSLVFLILALVVVARYRKLWCLRNIIHCNLIMCFTLYNIIWIVYSLVAHELMMKHYEIEENGYCYIPTTVLKYFSTAGFFWMFVEGLYLLISVAFSFRAKRIQFWMCAVFGWVIPLLLIVITTIAKAKGDRAEECWNEQHHLDFIFIGPVLCILLLNVIFLVIIMYVVVTKLQVTVPAEATRYRKAIKALFILCPLLGVNYIFVLVQPSKPLWANLLFSYYMTITASFQGSLVAILFCFRNNEVWQTVKKSVRKWNRAVEESHKVRRSMRIDTQSSVMIELEQSSGAWQTRRNVSCDSKTGSAGKNRGRTGCKRSTTNVVIMRDDGELRRFLPRSTSVVATNGGRKLTAPAKLSQRQSGGEQGPICELEWDRNRPAPVHRSRQKRDEKTERRSASNYRPVKGRAGVRYAYSNERTSAF